jgi:hypothetical protein
MRHEVRIESTKDIGAAEPINVTTRHFDVKYAIEDAVIKAANVVVG